MNRLLEVRHVAVAYQTYNGTVQSVRDISFAMEKGQTIALVGESGCGKSVTAKSIMGLVKKPGRILEGSEILFNGIDEVSRQRMFYDFPGRFGVAESYNENRETDY